MKDLENHPLAGKMTALLDGCTRLPLHLYYDANPQAHDQSFWPQIQAALESGMLLILDRGYPNFRVFRQFTEQDNTCIPGAKKNLNYEVDRLLHGSTAVHDRVVWIGQGDTRQPMRLIEVLYKGKWYRSLTNELDPLQLGIRCCPLLAGLAY